jgi:hypothetical protein
MSTKIGGLFFSSRSPERSNAALKPSTQELLEDKLRTLTRINIEKCEQAGGYYVVRRGEESPGKRELFVRVGDEEFRVIKDPSTDQINEMLPASMFSP